MKDGDPLGGRWRVEVDSPRRALPLTQMQSEMLRASVQRVGSARPYQLQTTVELRCRLDLFQLRSNWTRLWSDHRVLRCPSHLAPHNALPEIEVVEGHGVKAAAANAWKQGAGCAYDNAPLQLLVVRGAQHDAVVITAHHAVLDGAGVWHLMRSLIAPACPREGFTHAPESSQSGATAGEFSDFVGWFENHSTQQENSAYWKQLLAGVDVGHGIEWLQRTELQPHSSPTTVSVKREMPQQIADALRAKAIEFGVRPSTLTHAAVGLLLASCAGAPSAVFGTVRSMRHAPIDGIHAMLGNLATPIAVRVDVDPTATVGAFLAQVRQHDREGAGHSAIGLLELQTAVRGAIARPLDVMVVHNDRRALDHARDALGSDLVETIMLRQEATHPLVIKVGFGAAVDIEIIATTHDVAALRAERFADRLVMLMQALVEDDSRLLGALPVATAEESHAALAAGDGGLALINASRLDDLFRVQSARDPSAISVTDLERSLTYAQLEQRARSIAYALTHDDADVTRPVGAFLGRDVDLPAIHLGCWFAGRHFVPLDPELPAQRLHMMVREAGIETIIGRGDSAGFRDACQVKFIDLASIAWSCALEEIVQRPARDLAYAFFTSGSSGAPKLTLVEHLGAANYLSSIHACYKLPARTHAIQMIPVGFDPSIIELHLPLITGGCIGVLKPGEHVDFARVAQVAEQVGASFMTCVPSVLESFLESAPDALLDQMRSLRCVAVGGEAMPIPLPAAFYQRFSQHGTHLYNAYGPTETSIGVTAMAVRADMTSAIPLGHALPGVRLSIRDEQARVLPFGAVGELVIAGVQVGRGYAGDAEQTLARFGTEELTGARWYRTGDRASIDETGLIEYHGRSDFQFKVRGVRVEAGEIESVMTKVMGVASAAVWYSGEGAERKVIGYYKEQVDAPSNLEHALEAHLRSVFPVQLVPAAFVKVEQWPVGASGKIDRKQLQAPAQLGLRKADVAHRAHFAQKTSISERMMSGRVAEIFASVLRVSEVGLDDSFLRLGGDSLGSVLLIDRINSAFNAKLAISTFIADPTPAGIARALHSGGATLHIEPVAVIAQSNATEFVHCFPGVGGLAAFTYLGLAHELKQDAQLIGYQLPGVADNDQPCRTINAMARLLARRVTEHANGAPIHLLGFSFGGLLAVEVARVLSDAGTPVSSVVLLDVLPPSTRDRLRMLWRELRVAWRRRRGRGKKAPTYAAELGVQDFAEMTGLATIGARRPGLAAGELETRLRLLLRSTGLALMTHHMRPVLVPIELIVSLRADGPNTAKIQRPHERWRALARGGLHVTSVDCKHVEIVRAPGIPTIAQVLRSAIKRARETTQVV
ncbi:MAG: alpha/beta fold hydrolase [Planctomycetota bacterium]|nr:MAG: alpha/beta fold hydrolase [Planctomycetota bacterium]